MVEECLTLWTPGRRSLLCGENLVLGLQDAPGTPLRLSASEPGPPRRRGGPADRCAPGTRAAGPGPSPASRHRSSHRAAGGVLSSPLSPSPAFLFLSTDVLCSTVAVLRSEQAHRQRSRVHIGRKRRGKAIRPDSCRGTATLERTAVPASASPPISASDPATADVPHPMPGGPWRPCPIPWRTPAPL